MTHRNNWILFDPRSSGKRVFRKEPGFPEKVFVNDRPLPIEEARRYYKGLLDKGWRIVRQETIDRLRAEAEAASRASETQTVEDLEKEAAEIHAYDEYLREMRLQEWAEFLQDPDD